MERHIEKFIRYLEIEKNYSKHTILNYHLDLIDFKKFIGDGGIHQFPIDIVSDLIGRIGV